MNPRTMHLKSVQVIFYEIDILVLRLNQNVATYILIWIYSIGTLNI